MQRVTFVLMMCCVALPVFAQDTGNAIFVGGQVSGGLKPEFRACRLDSDCTYTEILGCVDHMVVSVAAKGVASEKINASNAAVSCIVPPPSLPPANPVHCLNNLCEWATPAQ